ncbi:MAG: pitrilysin family protein [Jaaginema sp. PMC 1079.18]|nr:pitrilysin family protein [Jaaginema sp. PMC 1080.18]MEC4849922.1 pitrilysin family protein [Jaaginema sp. PMC 1079.18]MEC4864894.1 pitrilysin family protein [Jaaginema sp. PMC 1078.18]
MQQLSRQIDSICFPASISTLDNGLTVIHQHLAATPVAVVDVWTKAGTSIEPPTWAGMAHFLEHMIFKGSQNTAPGEFDWLIENSGGVTNAATSHDYAHFYISTAAEYLPDTLPCFADILLNAAIDEAEFLREREVVVEEIRSCLDDPDWLGFQALCDSLYQCHVYGRSILGTEEQVRALSANQMRCFHRTHYQPENMTVAIVGGIERDRALALVESAFCEFNARSECPPNPIEAEPPLTGIRRTEMQFPRLEQARLSMAWITPGVEQLQDVYALDLLSVVLAGGRASRLVRELQQEQQIVFDIASEFTLQRDSSLFTISAWLDCDRLEATEALIRDRLRELHHTPIEEAELWRSQRLSCNDYAFSTETPSQLAGLYGYYQTIASAEVAVAYPQLIQQLQPQDLQRVARQYLSPDCYAVTIVTPLDA